MKKERTTPSLSGTSPPHLTLQQVEQWTASKPLEMVVGFACERTCCPLAQAARDLLQVPETHVVSVWTGIVIVDPHAGDRMILVETDFNVEGIVEHVDACEWERTYNAAADEEGSHAVVHAGDFLAILAEYEADQLEDENM